MSKSDKSKNEKSKGFSMSPPAEWIYIVFADQGRNEQAVMQIHDNSIISFIS